MLYYRLYFMNDGGHIVRFEELEAPADEAAINRARAYEGGQPMELWCQDRKVHRFEAVGGIRAPKAAE